MAPPTREALFVSLDVAQAEQALDDVLAERGFERTDGSLPDPGVSVARSDTRFFDLAAIEPSLSVIREWSGYSDATPWGAALELAEGLPPAARMEMALPPALSILARALSRRATVLGFAMREQPLHLVGVAFRGGRATDVITVVKDRIAVGAQGKPERFAPDEAKEKLSEWAAPHGVGPRAVEAVLAESDLPATWRLVYLHT